MDLETTHAWYRDLLGFLPSGRTRIVRGPLFSRMVGLPKVATTIITWVQRVYWGVSAVPGAYDEAFIKGLASNVLTDTRSRTINVNAGPGQKIYYCYRTGYGDATFTVNGFSGGFTKVATLMLHNIYGFGENYEIWESDNSNLGATTVVVS
jgi:hypothetical protein